MNRELERAHEALQCIPPDLPRDEWVRVGMGAHAAGLSFDDFDSWSAGASNYEASAARDTWRSFKDAGQSGRIGVGTLFRVAAEHGWSRNASATRYVRATGANPSSALPQVKLQHDVAAIWDCLKPAPEDHPYIIAKNGQGAPLEGLRVVPEGDPLRVMGESMAGALVVPCRRIDGSISSLQFVTVGETAARLRASKKPSKLNLPGYSLDGWFLVGNMQAGGRVFICEGIGAAWACWQATGVASVVCFGAGNMGKVSKALRQQDAAARLVLVPDVGKESDAQKIALQVGALVATMPEGEQNNFDANDLAQRDGVDVLAALLEAATVSTPLLPLSVAFAEELPEAFTPPDELVEGVLTAGDGSVLYGDSNSGKTFFVIDMAAAVARGVPWMGKNTEQGLVVYLAAESPASVRNRLQAYQKYHGVRVPNFAIVQSPIDLYAGEADTDSVIAVVQELERQRGQKARLIVGDTLARLSAGANENAGQDMGLVVRRIDRIRTACAAHFLLIHHSGKAAANGARGWSGIKAAVDTEIEVTDSLAGKCAEITKQRDLSTKGERIGFRLEPVTLGKTKWGAPATSCVVVAADAPDKPKGKRMGECDGAVLEFLAGHKVGIRKVDVVKHFAGRYDKGPVYRAMKALVTAQAIHEAAGMVAIAGAAK